MFDASIFTIYNWLYGACIRGEGGVLVNAMTGWLCPKLQIHEG